MRRTKPRIDDSDDVRISRCAFGVLGGARTATIRFILFGCAGGPLALGWIICFTIIRLAGVLVITLFFRLFASISLAWSLLLCSMILEFRCCFRARPLFDGNLRTLF